MSNGGLDDIIGREHCGNESEFKVGFLPILFAQDMDRITPKDDAVVTRMRAVHYEKPFVDSPSNEFELQKDPNMESEIHENPQKGQSKSFCGIQSFPREQSSRN